METVLANVGSWVQNMWWLEQGVLVVTVMVAGEQRRIVASTALEAIAAQAAAISQGVWTGKVEHGPEARVTELSLLDPVASVLFLSARLQEREAQIAALDEQVATLSSALLVEDDDAADSGETERTTWIGLPAPPRAPQSLGSTWSGISPPTTAISAPPRQQFTMPGGGQAHPVRQTMRVGASTGGVTT